MVQVKQTRKQKIKMYMGLPKSKLAELLYNCNEVIEEMMAHQKPYVIAPQDKAERRKTVAAKPAVQQRKAKTCLVVECDYCDGTGWFEGGKVLQTKCHECGGTGKLSAIA